MRQLPVSARKTADGAYRSQSTRQQRQSAEVVRGLFQLKPHVDAILKLAGHLQFARLEAKWLEAERFVKTPGSGIVFTNDQV